MTKHIFVIGGVLSSLGKGIASASIGFLLNKMGYSVAMQKLDPYLNLNSGFLSPLQHGEVYVTEDGGETDLDLGHYERFLGKPTSKLSGATSGKIYERVFQRERNREYNGQTVQVIPHVTNEIIETIHKNSHGSDVAIVEIGGTVGDIEILPFLEAVRQYRLEVGIKNSMFIFLTYIPFMRVAGELKTKPTQHAVNKLREIGIIPDIILCRAEVSLEEDMLKKIALFTNVPKTHVKTAVDARSIYEIPKNLFNEGVHKLICKQFGLKEKTVNFACWDEFLHRMQNPEAEINIVLCGKYIEQKDAYKSLEEALIHSGAWNKVRVKLHSIDSEIELSDEEYKVLLKDINGIIVPSGFGNRGINGKINIVKYARENDIPFLGICFGMQLAIIEFANNVCRLKNSNSTEIKPNPKNPVVHRIVKDNPMRLGAFPCRIKPGTYASSIYNKEVVFERHRNRYEFNEKYREIIEKNGMIISGTSQDGSLAEIIEIPTLKYFIGVQFHPEFLSSPDKPHPLINEFVRVAKGECGVRG